ncbi:MAG: ribonuclease [Lachnospiraceae bacterium]|jgi:glucan phosphoethanolaminetransferase (alkaline phosphatase superfamily)|nr:ribonuclease [Lachnospiraceae bacterium]
MNMEILMQYVTYALMAIGILAFLVAAIVQVIKELPWLQQIQTSVVALAVSLILCPLAVVIACQYFKIVIVWYYVFASFIAAFIVYLVATGGWERVAEMWNRTRYKGK